MEADDFELAIDYWLKEYPNMADKTRSSILTGVNGVLFVFNTGEVRTLVSRESNCSPENMLAGKWFIANMCRSEWRDQGTFIYAGLKYLTQKRVLLRQCDENSNPVIIFADEAQETVFISQDSSFLAQSRSHMGTMIYLTQSISSYYGALGGDKGKHLADTLMANFSHTIVHACDPITAEWAISKLGKRLHTYVGTSTAPTENLYDELMGAGKVTTSTSQHMDACLQTNELMHGVRTGGKAAGFICDGLVIKSGPPFGTGRNFLWVPFSQK